VACYHPITAYRTRGGDVTFKQGLGVGSSFQIPCGQCIGCRLERSRQWAMRCLYESHLHADNCYVTFTYSPGFLPPDGGLDKSHFQRFMKRLRRRYAPQLIRYFHCGEYGDQLGRPHYHALLFGIDFPDKVLYKDDDSPLYTSKILDSIWGYGECKLGAVTFESAAYVARYVMKKVTGDRSKRHYERVNLETGEIVSIQPEYITMSLKPGIGAGWFEKFSSDVFPSDFLIVNGVRVKPPKFFDKLLERSNPLLLEGIKHQRILSASRHKADNTVERLDDREQVATAQFSQLKRHKEF
jgi:hypothetical protein